MDSRCVTRLAIRQYKSIEKCQLELAPLTVFVGRNGVGKSNILDALRFVADALRNTLEYAFRERGGIEQVRRKSLGGRPTHPGVEVEVNLPGEGRARYSFTIAAVEGRSFRVDSERCQVWDQAGAVAEYEVKPNSGATWSLRTPPPAAASDRLFLVAASGTPEFRPLYDALTRMTFHNMNPELMKMPQRPEPGELLAHDGRNIAGVIKQLQSSGSGQLDRVLEYLAAVGVPLSRIQHKQVGAYETIEVSQSRTVPGGPRNVDFDAISLSDGTMRALGVLVSLVSARGKSDGGPTLIGIEEPETALHPAAAGALMEALSEGAERTQVLLTCHSPDLIDHARVDAGAIRPVIMENGTTRVGVLDAKKQDLLKRHLATAGELLRLDQLAPDPDDLRRQEAARGTLWQA